MNRLLLAFLLPAGTMIATAQQRNFEPPIMGWSSWNTYRVDINDSLIRRQAGAMVELGLKDKGYRYINIDDGFFGHRDADGKMHTHPERFPDGLKGIAEHIHALGLKAGIYSDAGSNTCGSIWDNDVNGVGAGLYGHEHEDAELYFKDWGFDFIKIDYCGAGQELNLDEERRYSEIRRAFDDVGCGNVSINICRWAFPGTWAKDLAQSWRISGDIAPDWNSVKHIIGKNLYLSAYCRDGHYNDMDMLEIGRGLSPSEEEVHFGIWCMMSSPLLIGCDLTDIPDASLRLLSNEELIAVNQDPLGRQAKVVLRVGEGYILAKDIGKLRGNTRAVAFYNPSESPCDMEIATKDLELSGTLRVRDLVQRRDLPDVRDGILRACLQPHSVKILRVEGEGRTEPEIYEAEWAYLPCFQDLGKTEKDVFYAPCPEASGGTVLQYLGGRRENHAVWDEVYSENGGDYLMTIDYVPRPYSKIEVAINQESPINIVPESPRNDGQKLASTTVRVRLNPGFNRITMGNAYGWTPDIDCFRLKRLAR